METNDFYQQLLKAHRTGIDPETNLLASERELIDDAIAYLKYKALIAAAEGKNGIRWSISFVSSTKTYPRPGQKDKEFDELKLLRMMSQSPEFFAITETLMIKELVGEHEISTPKNVFFMIHKNNNGSYQSFDIHLSWVSPDMEE